MSRYLFALIAILSQPAFSGFEWVTIEKGSYQGSGFARDYWTAVDRCAKDVEKQYIALAQRCCETNDNTTSAAYGGRCAGGYNGAKNPRSFDGGLAAYLCWPTNTAQELASGYWFVRSPVRPYKCQELIDTSQPVPKLNTYTYTPANPAYQGVPTAIAPYLP